MLVAGVLLAVVGATRLPAPCRLAVTNDEAHHHLESWRNRYRTADVFPLFFDRLRETNSQGSAATWLERQYRQHPELVARALFVVIDPQPPLWPVTAETIEAATRSSLVAQRIPSLLASCLAVSLAYLIGRRLGGSSAGLCVATLFAIGSLPQYYAGIARPYALAQAMILLVIYAFIVDRVDRPKSPRWFLLAALAAQATQWMAWAVVGPLVVVDLVQRARIDRSFRKLAKETWWYGLASLLLLGEMALQWRNPTVSNQRAAPTLEEFAKCIVGASPFSHLVLAFPVFHGIVLAAYVIMLVAAFAWLIRARHVDRGVRVALALALVASCLAPAVLGLSQRFMMSYMVPPTLLMGLALSDALRADRVRLPVMVACLAGFGGLGVWNLAAPYARGVAAEPDWSLVAKTLKSSLQPGDRWVSYPYFWANNLYRYGTFPEPMLPQSIGSFEKTLAERAPSSSLFVLSTGSVIRRFADLGDARVIAEFMAPEDCYLLLWLRAEHELQSAPPTEAAKTAQSADTAPANTAPLLREFKAGLYCHKPSDMAGARDVRQVSP